MVILGVKAHINIARQFNKDNSSGICQIISNEAPYNIPARLRGLQCANEHLVNIKFDLEIGPGAIIKDCISLAPFYFPSLRPVT